VGARRCSGMRLEGSRSGSSRRQKRPGPQDRSKQTRPLQLSPETGDRARGGRRILGRSRISVGCMQRWIGVSGAVCSTRSRSTSSNICADLSRPLSTVYLGRRLRRCSRSTAPPPCRGFDADRHPTASLTSSTHRSGGSRGHQPPPPPRTTPAGGA